MFGTGESPVSIITHTVTNATEWIFNIGGIEGDDEFSLGLQIPIYVIISAILDAYVKYLFVSIRQFQSFNWQNLGNLKKSFVDHRTLVNRICRATGFNYSEIEKECKLNNNKTKFIQIKHLEKYFDKCHDEIFKLPPDCKGIFSEYISDCFKRLDDEEYRFENLRFKISFEVNHQTLEMVALFFLAPILAIIAWLLLLVAGTSDWKVFAVTSFASGFIAKSIISKMQQIAGDPLAEAPDKKPKKPKNLPENSP